MTDQRKVGDSVWATTRHGPLFTGRVTSGRFVITDILDEGFIVGSTETLYRIMSSDSSVVQYVYVGELHDTEEECQRGVFLAALSGHAVQRASAVLDLEDD